MIIVGIPLVIFVLVFEKNTVPSVCNVKIEMRIICTQPDSIIVCLPMPINIEFGRKHKC